MIFHLKYGSYHSVCTSCLGKPTISLSYLTRDISRSMILVKDELKSLQMDANDLAEFAFAQCLLLDALQPLAMSRIRHSARAQDNFALIHESFQETDVKLSGIWVYGPTRGCHI